MRSWRAQKSRHEAGFLLSGAGARLLENVHLYAEPFPLVA